MTNPLFDQWREAAEKATLAEKLVYDKTAAAQCPSDLPSDAELTAAILLRLKAADLLVTLLAETRAQYAKRHDALGRRQAGSRTAPS